ncbi:MAG: nuclear transport factor 2 family protein [Flavobacteriales bacterium]|nr:nuclear transport factor 2 family protein [Flavobacteriales bacterium]
MDTEKMNAFATRYTTAWCSQNAASVAAHFATDGSVKINAGGPAVGREAIAASAQAFTTAFPDMIVQLDNLSFWKVTMQYTTGH